MTSSSSKKTEGMPRGSSYPAVVYVIELAGIAIAYFVLAKIGLALASINPSASPIWPPTGFALAAILLWGYRVFPAIFLAALVANVTTAGSIETASSIAAGNTLEAVVGGYLINLWSGGRNTFATPSGVAKFALVSLAVATPISATVGVASLTLADFADPAKFWQIWLTWWLGDLAGALVIAPVVVLCAMSDARSFERRELLETGAVIVAACGVGIFAFTPLILKSANWDPLGFLAILPLLWAALRRGQRDTAIAALILSCFAIWGTMLGGSPFVRNDLNDSFLLLLMFLISTSLPSLALSADVVQRRTAEEVLRRTQAELDTRVQERTAELAATNQTLQAEIEQRKRAESELQQQRVHLLEAQRMANLGSFVWDVGGNKVNWSDQLMQIYGVRAGEFQGTVDDFLARVHPDDRERVRDAITRAYSKGDRFQHGERIVRPNGEIRHLISSGEVVKDDQGNVVRVLGICQDVTERKVAEDALRQSEENYRILINGIRDYAIFMLDKNGYVKSWNVGAERITQYTATEAVGKHYRIFFADDECRRGVPERVLDIAARSGTQEAEGWRVRKDGSLFWASVVVDAIRDQQGALVGYAKITRDITESRETQAALQETREQLTQAQKMEALGQLTGGIAHDFNNLLMIIAGHTQILSRRLADPELKIPQSLDAIGVAAKRGANLTHQLLSFARRQRLNPEVVRLADRIGEMQGMIKSSLRGDIEFDCDIAADIWTIDIDVSELELALLNISVNARDAMPDGGTFSLTARNVRLKPSMNDLRLDGEFVALSMSDTGVGIAPEVISKIFEPFFTTKHDGKGTGLGLSQVYGFARQAGGAVDVKSGIGQGTTVTIYLPRTRKPAQPGAEPAAVDVGGGRNGTVLVVEDNTEVAEVTASLLRQLGYRAMRAENASDALAKLRHGDEFQLVLSDIVMPGKMNGIDLAEEIKRSYPEMPVLLTSGYSDAAQAAETRFVILRKPIDLTVLDKAIQDCLHSGTRH
jgi:PAS domain S-box-containing protein